MEINLFSDMKPTWNLLGFDEAIDKIPAVSKEQGRGMDKNPLDLDTVIFFRPVGFREYIYYLPRSGKVRTTDTYLYGGRDAAELFGAKVNGIFLVCPGKNECNRHFFHEIIIGNYLVFRRFESSVACFKKPSGEYGCSMTSPREVCRYVFGIGGIIIENRDGTRIITSTDSILSETGEDVYDTLNDADELYRSSLYRNFIECVDIVHKKEILQALTRVKKEHPKLGFNPFMEIYDKAILSRKIPDETTKRIIRELNIRSHKPYTLEWRF